MVRGLSSPTGRCPEPKQASNVPCEDQEHDPSILHCRNQGRYVAGQPEHTCQLDARGWPRLEAALRLLWRWRGVLDGGAKLCRN